MTRKDFIWVILIPLLLSLAVAFYAQFDFYCASNNKDIIEQGWYQFLKMVYAVVFIGGGFAWFLYELKKITIDQSETIRNIQLTKDEIVKTKDELQTTTGSINESIVQIDEELQKKIKRIDEHFEGINNRIIQENSMLIKNFFFNDPFKFFGKELNHTGVIGTLLNRSLEGGLTSLSVEDRGEYMRIINEAVTFTDKFCGVNRRSISSFYDDINHDHAKEFHATFHRRLKDINPKGRIFIIEDDKYDSFMKELIDQKYMPRFHLETLGINTFFTKLSSIKEHFSDLNGDFTYYDFGIYDDLIIRFNNEDTVKYNLLKENEKKKDNVEIEIFRLLFNEILKDNFKIFTPLFLYSYKDKMEFDELKKRNIYKVDQDFFVHQDILTYYFDLDNDFNKKNKNYADFLLTDSSGKNEPMTEYTWKEHFKAMPKIIQGEKIYSDSKWNSFKNMMRIFSDEFEAMIKKHNDTT